jgi:hypothetical protein
VTAAWSPIMNGSGRGSNHLRPAHMRAAQLLKQQRFTVVPPAAETQVEQRYLADYDSALGL